jgi:hypothetical protein
MGKLWGKKQTQKQDDADWSAWLSDEPVPQRQHTDGFVTPSVKSRPANQLASNRERVRYAGINREQPRPPAAPNTKSDDISINIKIKKPTLPDVAQLKELKKRTKKLPSKLRKKPKVLAVGGFALAVMIVVVIGIARNGSPQTASTAPDSFKPLVPKDSQGVAGVSDTKLSSEDGVGELFTFPDTFLDKPVTVSQQKLPDEFKTEADPAQKVAAQLGKTEQVSTAFGPVYFTTDKKSPMQTIIFVYRDSLAFITSATHRDGDTWKIYIESLRP